MTKILIGVYDAENGHVAEGEAALRDVITMEVPRRPWVEPPLHATAQGFLAVLLKAEGRPIDAHRLSDPLCAGSDNPDITEMLVKSKLCGPG